MLQRRSKASCWLVVDTNIVSYGFRQEKVFVDFYGPAMVGHEVVVSFMTVAELEYGVRRRGWGEQRRRSLREYLDRNDVMYGVSRELVDAWARLIAEAQSQGRVLSSSDGWIAATAAVLGVPLVTHNAKDFARLGGVTLISASPA